MLRNFIYTYRQAFRFWMRQKTVPLTVEEAELKQYFWAKMYAFCGIGCLVFSTYIAYRNKSNFGFAKELPVEKASLMAISDKNPVKVIKMVGLTKVDELTYTKEEVQEIQKEIKQKYNSGK